MATTYPLVPMPFWIFTDKTGRPAANGKVFFLYSDSRLPRAVFKDPAGMFPWDSVDGLELDGAGMVPGGLFFEDDTLTTYYVEIFNANGDLERSIDGLPTILNVGGGGTINTFVTTDNYVDNVDFKFNVGTISPVPVGKTKIAPGKWYIEKNENFTVDTLSFNRIPLGAITPLANPEFEFVYSATAFSGAETKKDIYIEFSNVKSFQNEQITIDFWAKSSVAANGQIVIIQHFGTGGSPSNDTIQLIPFSFLTAYTRITQTFTINSVLTKSLGTNNDDFVSIGIRLPLTTPGDFYGTEFRIVRGDKVPPDGTFDTVTQTTYKTIYDNPLSIINLIYQPGSIIYTFVDNGTYGLLGFIRLEDQTIGNTGSGAVSSNPIYINLFTTLWNNTNDTNCPVSGGRGASALADWNALKTLRLPLAAGRVFGINGSGGGLTPRVNASSTGEEGHVLTIDELAAHRHNILSVTAGSFSGQFFSNVSARPTNQLVTETETTGADQAHNNMQPTTFCFSYIKY